MTVCSTLLVLAGLSGVSAMSSVGSHFIMPWICLERCGDNSTDIAAQLHQFAVNGSVLNAASFEDYNLGANSQLIKNNLTQVALPLKKLGISTWAMVSSYPYPPEFLTWMRQVSIPDRTRKAGFYSGCAA
jgi:hypothetical protein